MSYLTEHWSFDPFLIVAIVLVGLARDRPGPAGPAVPPGAHPAAPAALAVVLRRAGGAADRGQSPIDYWADDYFFVHMIQHLLLMFAAPTLIVAGAPWQPLLDGLPGRAGRSATAEVMRGGWSRPLRAVGGWLLRPWVAVTRSTS